MRKIIFGLVFFFALIFNSNAQVNQYSCTNATIMFDRQDQKFRLDCKSVHYDKTDKTLYISLDIKHKDRFIVLQYYTLYIESGNSHLCLDGELRSIKFAYDQSLRMEFYIK